MSEKTPIPLNFGMIVDPPSPFAPVEELETFLRSAQAFPQDDPNVKWAIEQTEQALAERQK